MSRLVVFLALIAVAVCQPQIVAYLDTFETPSQTLLIIVNGTFPSSVFTSTVASDIIGGERDLILTAFEGPINRVISTAVVNGAWQSASPNQVTAAAELQYDGKDASPNLNPVGLGGVDLTKSGANAFLISAQADIPCEFTVSVYSGADQVSYQTVHVPASSEQDFVLNYASFAGNATFNNVGAVVVEVELNSNVDFLVSQLAIVAPATDLLTIDPFEPVTNALVIIISNTNPFPQSSQASTQGSGILGGERDVLLTVDNGLSNRIVVTEVNQNSWSTSVPSQVSASALLQYDGVDGSASLNPVGLGGIDLTANGGKSFHLQIYADVPTASKITVYTDATHFSSTQINLPGGSQSEFIVNFSTFAGSADFTNAGAIELEVDGTGNNDVVVTLFTVSSH